MNALIESVNTAILGDSERYPLNIEASKRCIQYWFKSTEMPNERYVKNVIIGLICKMKTDLFI